ncbi:hypothetical protein JHK82_043278 [Glycine max]|nr:hypothetical protein JHK82_043278 [Glycine max]
MADSYIGSLISLTSKSEIKYEGSDESMMAKAAMMGGVLSGKSTVVGAQLVSLTVALAVSLTINLIVSLVVTLTLVVVVVLDFGVNGE